MKKFDNLGDRIKRYEQAYNQTLTPRSCLFIRVDGNAFHTWTRGMGKPFDQTLIDAMVYATTETSKSMMGFKLAYTQSDETTFMLTDFDQLQSQGWFAYELNKVVSVTASMFTAHFNVAVAHLGRKPATFDARAFIVPQDDAPNVFVWRYKDWLRNSIQMLARANYSSKELHLKKTPELHEMLFAKGVNWAKLSEQHKNGTFVTRNFETTYPAATYETIASALHEALPNAVGPRDAGVYDAQPEHKGDI